MSTRHFQDQHPSLKKKNKIKQTNKKTMAEMESKNIFKKCVGQDRLLG